MTRRGAGAWQRSTAYDRDRRRVERLVLLTGAQRLAFNAYDVARTARQHPELRLEQSGELHRHLRDLRVTHATPVGPELIALRVREKAQRHLASGRPGGAPDEATRSSRPERRVRRWVLTSRLPEWEANGGGCTDAEKVYLAVWVASAALATRIVPTITVTRVLSLIAELRLADYTQTNVLLTRLAERTPPLVRAVKSEAEHWVGWEPLDDGPEHPLLTKWTDEVRRLVEDGGALPITEHATRNVATRELLKRTIQSTRSKDWPAGRPVSARDIRLHAATDPVARDLLLRVTANGGSLGRALHEASRQRAGASPRRGVHRIVGPAGERHIRYDVPAVPGHDIRLQSANFDTLRPLASQDRLLQMDEERRRAESLGRAVPSAAGLAAVRQLTVAIQLERALGLLDMVSAVAARFGTGPRKELGVMRAHIDSFRALHAVHEQVAESAYDALREVGAHPLTWALELERPYLTARQYVGFCPVGWFGADTPATVISRATALTRFANPHHTTRQDADPDRAAAIVVDRAEALLHLAEQGRGGVLAFLTSGMGLLGRYLRDARLVRPLVGDCNARVQQAALAALTLLGAEDTAATAQAWIGDPASTPEIIVSSLHALHVLQQTSVAILPPHVRTHGHPLVRRTVREVLDASRDGRWLLQRG